MTRMLECSFTRLRASDWGASEKGLRLLKGLATVSIRATQIGLVDFFVCLIFLFFFLLILLLGEKVTTVTGRVIDLEKLESGSY